MSRHQKPRQPKSRAGGAPRDAVAPPPGAVDAAVAKVRAQLAAGRSMAALREAKELAKRWPADATEALLLDAYEARIADLSATGMAKEAADLLQLVKARFPQRAAAWDEAGLAAALRRGDAAPVLREWARADLADERREALAALLRRELRDPDDVVRANVLPADDALVTAARAASTAFAEAAAGALSQAAREGLREVGRRSPLAPWRDFVLALAAWHQEDDEAARAAIARVPADAGVARLSTLLGAILDGAATSADWTPAERQLVQRAGGGVQTVLDGAIRLREAWANVAAGSHGARQRVLETLRELAAPLAGHRRELAMRLFRWTRQNLRRADEEERMLDLFEPLLPPREVLRLIADDYGGDPLEQLLLWWYWLLPGPEKPMRPLADLELALLLDHTLPLVQRAWQLAGERARDLGWPTGSLHPIEDARAVADLLFEARGDFDAERLAEYLLMQRDLLRTLRQRTAAGVSASAPPAVQLGWHAVRLQPTSARFAALHDAAERAGGAAAAAAVLEAWLAELPQDARAWLWRARTEEKQRAPARALEAIRRAEELAPLDSEVRAARLRLEFLRLRGHLAREQWQALEQDLERLAALPGAQMREGRALLAAVRVLRVEQQGGDTGAATAALQTAAGSEVTAAAALRLARHWREPLADEELLPPGGTVRERLAALAAFVRIGVRLGDGPAELIGGVHLPFELRSARPDELPADLEDQLALCVLAEELALADLAHVASGLALRADGPHLPRAARHRAAALAIAQLHPSLEYECLQLARHLAERAQDQALLAEIERRAASFGGVAPLLVAEAQRLLERERGLLTLAERTQQQEPSRRRRASRRKRSGETAGGAAPMLPFGEESAEGDVT